MSAIHIEFDITDERLHVDFGKKWGAELHKQIGQMVTARELAERAKIKRMEDLAALSYEDAKKIVKNFPMFCGFSTVDLNYDSY